MNLKTLKLIIANKQNNSEFAIITNLSTGEVDLLEKNIELNKKFEKYFKKIQYFFEKKQNGIIDNSDLFIETFKQPIKVIIVGAVHIAQYLVDYIKNFNFKIYIIDPRGYFASKKRFSNIDVINKWPDEAFSKIKTDEATALITLTHDPKIDDPAIKHALNNNFYYIGALGSNKTHSDRCNRLREAGYNDKQISLIHGPIGIKLGGKSAPEIALSIISQLVLITNNR